MSIISNAFITIARKEIVRIIRIWPQTIIPPVIITSLYFTIFGKFIGSRIGTMEGVSYIHFISPGLVIMSIINNSYANVVSSFFGAKFQHSIEEILISPMSIPTIILGYLSGGVFRGLLVGLFVYIIASFFAVLPVKNLTLTLTVAFLTSVLFSLAGLINAIFSRKFDDVTIIPTFIIGPLIYLGGVFYSVSAISESWQFFVKINPLYYVVDSFRYAILEISDENISYSIFFLIASIILLYTVSHYLIKKGIGLKS